MNYRHLFPILRILAPLVAGILVSVFVKAAHVIPWELLLFLFCLLIILAFARLRRWKFYKGSIFGILATFTFFLLGFNLVVLNRQNLQAGHISHYTGTQTVVGQVWEPLQEKEHSYKTILKVKQIQSGNNSIAANGLLLAYFEKDSLISLPQQGSTLVFNAQLQEIRPPQNPGAFDYQRYMAANNVYNQVYIRKTAWKMLAPPQGFSLLRYANHLRENLLQKLQQSGLHGSEFAVAAALMLGQSDRMDAETLHDYAGAGVMHILSVSGFHVGVIFGIISLLLGFMKKNKFQIYLKTALILLTIWAYALLTGMAPATSRAALMFSFIALGNLSDRYVHVVNSISVSALVLLLIHPFIILNVGFQLSYLAILGIVFIYQPLVKLWQPQSKILNSLWKLVVVSIAAQLATTPLTLYYFHQFPLYFLAANMVAVPLSFVIIYAGLLTLLTSALPAVSLFFGVITSYLLTVLNKSMAFIENLPFSVQPVTNVFSLEAVLLYLVLISAMLALYLKRKSFVFVSLFLLLMCSGSFALTQMLRARQQVFVVYNVPKYSATGFIEGKQQQILADSAVISDAKIQSFQLDGSKQQYGIKQTIYSNIKTPLNQPVTTLAQASENSYFFAGKRIAFIDKYIDNENNTSKLKLDYLVIQHNPFLKIEHLLNQYQPQWVIIDGSNSNYKAEKWTKELIEKGVRVYNTKTQGAFVADFSNKRKML